MFNQKKFTQVFLVGFLFMTIACEEKKDDIPVVNMNGQWKLLSTETSGAGFGSRTEMPNEELPIYWQLEGTKFEVINKTVKDPRKTISGQFLLPFQVQTLEIFSIGVNLYHVRGDSIEITYRALDRIPDPSGDILRVQKTLRDQSMIFRLQQVPAEKMVEVRSKLSDTLKFEGSLSLSHKDNSLQLANSSTNQKSECLVFKKAGEDLRLQILNSGTREGLEITFDQRHFRLSSVDEPLKAKDLVLGLNPSEKEADEAVQISVEDCTKKTIKRNGDWISVELQCSKDQTSISGTVRCMPVLPLLTDDSINI